MHVENSTTYFLALKNAKVPAEMHLYAEGGHGYGLRRTELPVTDWPKLVETWLQTIHVVAGARSSGASASVSPQIDQRDVDSSAGISA